MNAQYSFEDESFEMDSEMEESGELGDEFEDTEFDPESDSSGEMEEAEEEFEGEFEGEFEEEASPRGGDVQKKIQQLRAAHTKLSQAVGTMGKHITQSNGAHRLAVRARSAQEAAARLRINPRLFALLHNSMKRRNAQLRGRGQGRGELELEASAPSCPGRTQVNPRWWGIQVYLNECHTKALIESLKAGSGGAALCTAISPVPHVKAVCAALTALGAVGAAAISGIDSLGGNRGIIISKVMDPFTPPVVWHQ